MSQDKPPISIDELAGYANNRGNISNSIPKDELIDDDKSKAKSFISYGLTGFAFLQIIKGLLLYAMLYMLHPLYPSIIPEVSWYLPIMLQLTYSCYRNIKV